MAGKVGEAVRAQWAQGTESRESEREAGGVPGRRKLFWESSGKSKA